MQKKYQIKKRKKFKEILKKEYDSSGYPINDIANEIK
jgi:hypothetical protein